MRAFLTGEEGFIARNLIRVAGDRLDFINDELKESLSFSCMPRNEKGEIDFINLHSIDALKRYMKCDVIIHNGAIVGTDVCGLHPRQAIANNVLGTYYIATLAKQLNVPVVYIGTTVIYDTQKIQHDCITEQSPIFPRTLYATTKYEGELIIRAYCQDSKYCILRPLFCYGGEGDMNSLIAKTMYNHLTKRNKPFKIFLDSSKSKDYMHVDDFCESIVIAATSQYILNFNTDFNISAGEPVETNKIVDEIENLGIDTSYIQWRPDTDYLGNHIVSNSKFKIATYNKWEPKVSLVEGLKRVRSEILSLPLNTEYNPFKHLDEIEEKDIDIETHYNFKG